MPQLDLQQEAVLTHLVVCLLLQLLDQPFQKLGRLHILLGVVKVDGVPVCRSEQCQGSCTLGQPQHPREGHTLTYHAWLSIHCDR